MIRLPLLAALTLSLAACASAPRQLASAHEPDEAQIRATYLKQLVQKSAKGGVLQDAEYRPGDCDPDHGNDGESCVAVTCSMGAYDCKNYQSSLEKVASLCQGGVRGGCVRDICGMGAYDCKNYQSSLEKVLNLCKGINPGCVKTVCDFGAYDCRNYQSSLEKVASLCQGWVPVSCVRDMCSMGSYDCKNYQSSLEKVIQLCKQQR